MARASLEASTRIALSHPSTPPPHLNTTRRLNSFLGLPALRLLNGLEALLKQNGASPVPYVARELDTSLGVVRSQGLRGGCSFRGHRIATFGGYAFGIVLSPVANYSAAHTWHTSGHSFS